MRSSRSAIAEEVELAKSLTPLARLALAYAPASARADWLTLLALDARLAGIVRSAREPMLAQLRLAWWRDRLSGDPAGWPKGEPLLRRLAGWGAEASGLAALVDGWEALLGEAPLDPAALAAFADGRSAAVAALAGQINADRSGARGHARRWALADLVLHLGDPAERSSAAALLSEALAHPRLPAPLRPLAVLGGLSERAVRRGAAEALSGPGALLAAIRLGILGG